MWIEFIANMLIGIALLYIPGFFLFKALRFHTTTAICAAPLASMAFYASIPIVLNFLNVSCSWTTVFLPALAISLICYVASRRTKNNKPDIFRSLQGASNLVLSLPNRWLIPGLYLTCGITIGAILYIGNLGDPASFKASNDNITHLNLIRAFIDSGQWDALHTSNYLAADQNAQASKSIGFYPAAWHAFAALMGSITASEPTLLCNAENAIWIMIVYPLGTYLLMSAIFPDNARIVGAGSLACIAFNAWPWWLMLKGPIYPAMSSFILMLPAIAIALHFLRTNKPTPLSTILITAGMAIVSLALLQPSSLFAVVVFLALPLALKAGQEAKRRLPDIRYAQAIGIVIALGLIAVFWILCFTAPFMHDVVWYEWKPQYTMSESFMRAITLSIFGDVPQIALAAVITIGVIAILRSKGNRWALAPWAFFIVAYVFGTATGGFTRHLLGGFWYVDPARLGSLICIAAIPIAATGISFSLELIYSSVHRRLNKQSAIATGSTAIVIFCLINFCPSLPAESHDGTAQRTPFGYTLARFESSYAASENRIYSTKEEEFVDKALCAIPDGALVINQPNDGSVFAYAVNDLNTYYRYIVPSSAEVPEATIIREKLNEIASNSDVQAAVSSTGAQYVLLLDQGVAREDQVRFPRDRDESLWQGINSITDSTPGFEVILAEGDMRLYKITCL